MMRFVEESIIVVHNQSFQEMLMVKTETIECINPIQMQHVRKKQSSISLRLVIKQSFNNSSAQRSFHRSKADTYTETICFHTSPCKTQQYIKSRI